MKGGLAMDSSRKGKRAEGREGGSREGTIILSAEGEEIREGGQRETILGIGPRDQRTRALKIHPSLGAKFYQECKARNGNAKRQR